MLSVAVPERVGVLSELGSGISAVKLILGASASYVENAIETSSNVGVETESVLASESWY